MTMKKIADYYVARNAVITGDVSIGPDASIWYGAVLRGDIGPIRIGARTNVQDGSLLHCKMGVPLEIAEDVTIGHCAVVHCRRIGRGSLIAIRATLLDDVEVGENCVIAAGAVVVPGTIIPDNSVVMGVPGRVVRPTSEEEKAYVALAVRVYVKLAGQYARGEITDRMQPQAPEP